MGLLDIFTRKKTNQTTLKTEDFCVVGVNYYTENLHKLACANPDWKNTIATIIKNDKANTKIFRYSYINKPVKLIEEPNNKHDRNAVQVIIAGELVGYISRDYNVHVKEILKKKNIKYISSFISGGQYKIILNDKTMIKDEQQISINVRIAYT